MAIAPSDEEAVFKVAYKIASPEARNAYLKQACGDNSTLRDRLDALLRMHDEEQSFLESPPPGIDGAIESLSLAEQPGKTVGHYKLSKQIGEGGFGVVWMAEQTEPVQRKVALKVLKAGMDTHQVVSRFEAERQALAMMDHPNIAKVFDGGATSSGRPYFVMELVEGEPITKYCDEHRSTLRERLELLVPVCQAIHHAHQKGIIHRDVKPSNVLIASYDGLSVPKVIDFGVAKATGQQLTEDRVVTEFGMLMGTLEYMSPEQATLNNQDIDTRSDIYSLGVLLYELLTGTTPLSRARLTQTAFTEKLRLIREEEPTKPSTKLSESKESSPLIAAQRQTEPIKLTKLVRGELDWIVMKALEKDRNRRYTSASELAEDLGCFLDDRPIKARPIGTLTRFWRLCRRNRLSAVMWGSAALVSIVLVVSVVVLSQMRAQAAEDRAKGAQVNASEIQLQNILATTRTNGWFEKVWEMQSDVVPLCDKETLSTLRDQTASALSGLDARISKRIVSFGAGRVLFDRQGERVLLGSVHDEGKRLIGTKLWNSKTDQFRDLEIASSGPVAFSRRGVPLQLIVRKKEHNLILMDLLHKTPATQFRLPEGARLSDSCEPVLLSDGSLAAASIIAADKEAALAVWDGVSGRLLQQFSMRRVTVTAFSPDGSLLAAGDEDGQVLIGSLKSGEWFATFRTSHVGVTCLAFARDPYKPHIQHSDTEGYSWLLAAGDEAGGLTIWDVGARVPRSFCRGSHYQVLSVTFSPDAATLASGGRGEVRLWDVATGRVLLRSAVGDGIADLAFSPDGRRLCCGCQPPFCHLPLFYMWDLDYGRGISTYRGLVSQVSKVSLSADSRYLAALAHNWQLGIWELGTGRLLHILDGPKGVSADNAGLAFSPDGRRLALSTGREARLWDVEKGETLRSWRLPQGLCDALVFSGPDSLLLLRNETRDLSAGPFFNEYRPDKYPRVCRLRNLLNNTPTQPIAEIGDFNWHVLSIVCSSEGRYFAIDGLGGVNGTNRTVLLLDSYGKNLHAFRSNCRSGYGLLTFDRSQTILAMLHEDGVRAILLEVPSGKYAGVLPKFPDCLGPKANVWAHRGTPKEWWHGLWYFRRESHDALLGLGLDAGVTSLSSFDATGALLAWGSDDGTVSVANIPEVQRRLAQLGLGWE
jgi:eukaryotic-like serine/threonine-protein kinase